MESGESKEKKIDERHAATRENPDAIPTAGGEKLGQKHWGESKVVPENPKPQSEAGITSSHNSDTVRDNTNRNTGSATEPGSEAHAKESMVDKMKDKMHLGGH
ncbi:hypothetical protein LTR08_006580 [Meristemomyces frigidus]|nr:hypothetical protein LTR08_006580 [Meristemomyces frigidus]